MTLKAYLRSIGTTIKSLHIESGVPYTTVSEIVNGKVNIDRVYVGTAMKLARACQISFPEFYDMCKETTELPTIKDGKIVIKNKKYYIEYDIEGEKGQRSLLKVNEVNQHFIKDSAEWMLSDIKEEIRKKKEVEEIESWTPDNTI